MDESTSDASVTPTIKLLDDYTSDLEPYELDLYEIESSLEEQQMSLSKTSAQPSANDLQDTIYVNSSELTKESSEYFEFPTERDNISIEELQSLFEDEEFYDALETNTTEELKVKSMTVSIDDGVIRIESDALSAPQQAETHDDLASSTMSLQLTPLNKARVPVTTWTQKFGTVYTVLPTDDRNHYI